MKSGNNNFSCVISVVVPIYNCEDTLTSCVKSVINQSHKNIELILVNDGSTDTSYKIAKDFASNDQRIKVIDKINGGPASARNAGIKISKGEFIFFLDADDYLNNNALDLLIKSYNKYKADIVIGDFNKIYKGTIANRNDICFPRSKLLNKKDIVEYSRQYLKKPNKHLLFAFSWGRLFKLSIIKNNKILFNDKLHTFEDVAFNFDYLMHANQIYFLKTVVYNYLVHDNFLSASMGIGKNPNNLFGHMDGLKRVTKFLHRNLNKDDVEKIVGHAYTYLTITQLVRTCGQICANNKKPIVDFIAKLVNDTKLRNSLGFYSPDKGESKIIPLLIKLKLVLPIIWVCKYKAYKRYGAVTNKHAVLAKR